MYLSHKLNKAWIAIRATKIVLTWKSWKMVYYSYFHSVMYYGIIFWGTSTYSNNILRIQKRIIRIITNSSKCESCRQMYKQLQILTVYGQHIYSRLMFVVKSREVFFSKLWYTWQKYPLQSQSAFSNNKHEVSSERCLVFRS